MHPFEDTETTVTIRVLHRIAHPSADRQFAAYRRRPSVWSGNLPTVRDSRCHRRTSSAAATETPRTSTYCPPTVESDSEDNQDQNAHRSYSRSDARSSDSPTTGHKRPAPPEVAGRAYQTRRRSTSTSNIGEMSAGTTNRRPTTTSFGNTRMEREPILQPSAAVNTSNHW